MCIMSHVYLMKHNIYKSDVIQCCQCYIKVSNAVDFVCIQCNTNDVV